MNGLMQIGDVAMRAGLTVDAIRFYEREQLLHTAARSSGGFRLFSIGDVEDLTLIRNAQELGFSLGEIRELLGLKRTSHPDLWDDLAKKISEIGCKRGAKCLWSPFASSRYSVHRFPAFRYHG